LNKTNIYALKGNFIQLILNKKAKPCSYQNWYGALSSRNLLKQRNFFYFNNKLYKKR